MARPSTRRYAENTTVPADQTRLEIERLIKTNGGINIIYGEANGVGRLVFKLRNRHIRFDLKLPDEKTQAKEHRRRWRALLLVLKGKLEALFDDTIETFEEAFLAHTVMPNGDTVAEAMLPQIADAYRTGQQPPMVLALPSSPTKRP